MNCGWCGSDKLEYEYVDIGVGQQQVTPFECLSCGAAQITPDHFLNPDVPIDAEDERRGWYAGPESHGHAIYVQAPIRLVDKNSTIYARDFPFGQRVLVCWHQLTHVAYKSKNNKNDLFTTRCSLSFAVAATPMDHHVTCLVCITTED